MRKVLLEIPTHEEVNYIDQSLMAYNHSREPFLQTNLFIPVNRCLKNENGEVIGIERIRRVTGYLAGTLDRFNDAKKAEVRDRVKHMSINDPDTPMEQL